MAASTIEGNYVHLKNENLDQYFREVGIPYIPRNIMCMSSPTLKIEKSESNQWTIVTSTMLRTNSITFELDKEYEEHMPGGILKSVTMLGNNELKTTSVAPNGTKVSRIYQLTPDGCVIVMKHETSGIEAKRYFKRA